MHGVESKEAPWPKDGEVKKRKLRERAFWDSEEGEIWVGEKMVTDI